MRKKRHPLAIKDEFTDLPVSRQMKRQLRAKRDGYCVICGRVSFGGVRCERCREKDRARHLRERLARP